MPRIERFEDLRAWQKARELNVLVYDITSRGDLSRDFALRDQLRRASLSVMSNIAEGFGRGRDAEFRRFLSIARGSADEVKAQLYAAKDGRMVDDEAFTRGVVLLEETSRLMDKLMDYLARRGGSRHRQRPAR